MRQFLAGLLMVGGVLIALTTGLCSLTFTALFFVGSMKPGPETSIIILWIVIGFLVSAFGVWLFRRGRAGVRQD
jgi:hypothetical protein